MNYYLVAYTFGVFMGGIFYDTDILVSTAFLMTMILLLHLLEDGRKEGKK